MFMFVDAIIEWWKDKNKILKDYKANLRLIYHMGMH